MESTPLIESIRVCVKICPTRKVKEGSPSFIDGSTRLSEKKVDSHCISVVDEKKLQILPVNRCACELCLRRRQISPKTKAHSPDVIQKTFHFDHVLNHNSTQEELFDCIRENIGTLFSGISSTIVSFGPSGSGKTYVMRGEGNVENIGLIQRSVRAVFDRIRREKSDQYIVELSYIELAKNCFNNLLSSYISDSILKKSQSSSCLPRTPERFGSPSSRSRSPLQSDHKSYFYSPGQSPSRSPGRSPSRSPGLPCSPNRSPGPHASPTRGPLGDSSIPGAEGGWISVDERLELHSSPNGAVFFTGPRNAPTVSQIQVASEQEAMNAIFAGDKQLALLSKPNRRAGHLVISLHLTKMEPDAKPVPQATLQLVDLAVAGDRSDPNQPFADGGDLQFINRSMFALNEVLKRLAMNTERIGRAEISGGIGISDSCSVDSGFLGPSRTCSGAASVVSSSTTSSTAASVLHVPYMDSKLTMMLRDSLGGATRAVLVTSLKLEPSQFKQNLHTLEAVSRAGKVLKHICSSNSGCVESPAKLRAAFANSPSHKRPNILALSPEVVSRSQSNCKTQDCVTVSPQMNIPSPLGHSHMYSNHIRSQDRSNIHANIELSKILTTPSAEDPFNRLTASLTHALENFSKNADQQQPASNSQVKSLSSPQPGNTPLVATASEKDRSHQSHLNKTVRGMHNFPSIEGCGESPDQSLPLRARSRSQVRTISTSPERFSSSLMADNLQLNREDLSPINSPPRLESNVRSPMSSSERLHSSLQRSSRLENSNDPSLRSRSRSPSRNNPSPGRISMSPSSSPNAPQSHHRSRGHGSASEKLHSPLQHTSRIEENNKSPDQSSPLRSRSRSHIQTTSTSPGRYSMSPKAATPQLHREDPSPTGILSTRIVDLPHPIEPNIRSPTSSPNAAKSHNPSGSTSERLHSSPQRVSRREDSNESPPSPVRSRSHSLSRSSTSPGRQSPSPSRRSPSPSRLSIYPGRLSISPDRCSSPPKSVVPPLSQEFSPSKRLSRPSPTAHRDHSPERLHGSPHKEESVNVNSPQSPPSRNQRHGHMNRNSKQSEHADSSVSSSPSCTSPGSDHNSGCSSVSNRKLHNSEKTECSPSPLAPYIHHSSRVAPLEGIQDFNCEPISVEDAVSYLGIANGEGARQPVQTSNPNSPTKKSSFLIRCTPPYSPRSLISPKTKVSPNLTVGGNISQSKSGTISPHSLRSPIHGKQSLSSTVDRTTQSRPDNKFSSPKTDGGRTFAIEEFESNCDENDVQKSSKTSVSLSSSTSPQIFTPSPPTTLAHKLRRIPASESPEKSQPREDCVPIWQKKTAISLLREEDERRQKVQRDKQRLPLSPTNRLSEDSNRSPTLDGTYPEDSTFQGGLLENFEDLQRKCWEGIRAGSPQANEEPERAKLTDIKDSASSSDQVTRAADSVKQVDDLSARLPLSVYSPATIEVEKAELPKQRSRATTPSKDRPQSAMQHANFGDSQLKSTEQIDRNTDNALLKKKVEALRSAFAHINQKLQIASKDPKFNTELFAQSDQMITSCIVAQSESFETEKEWTTETDSGVVRVVKEKAWRKSLEKECACLKDLMKLEKIVSQCVDSRDAPIAKSVMKSLMKLLDTCDRLRSEISEVREQVEAKYATLLDGKDRMCLLREGLLNFMCSHDCFDENSKKLLHLVSQGGERAQMLESLRDKIRQALLAEMQRQEMESQLMFTRMRRVKDENEAEQQEIAEIEEERLAAVASLKKDYTEEARAGRAACMHSERTIKSLRSVRTELSLELDIIENIMVKINEEMVARTSANEIASSIDDLKTLLAASPVMSPIQGKSPAVSIARNNFLSNLNTTMDLTSPSTKAGLSAKAAIKQKFTFDNLENMNRVEPEVERVGNKLRVDLSPATSATANEKPESEEQSDKENRPENTSPRTNISPITSSERGKTASTLDKDRAATERVVKPPEASQSRSESTSQTPPHQPDALRPSQYGTDRADLRMLEASISEGRSLLEELLIFCDSFHDS